MSTLVDPWNVSEADFPRDGLVGDWLRFAIRYALLAPSSHNSQPWLFRVVGGTLELFADRTRALPVTDPHDRELIISCGAALFHLRLVLRHFGRHPKVTVFPDPHQPDLLARVELGPDEESTGDLDALFAAIPHRHTCRHPFEPLEVLPVMIEAFERDAKLEGALFVPASGTDQRHGVADLVAKGDQRQFADAAFRRELAAWLHWNRTRSHDGMPGYALGQGDVTSIVSPLAVRTFDMGGGRAAKDQELAEHSPLLAAIVTRHDTPRDWLVAGQALARVLLRGAANGVAASYLNQPIEVPELRSLLAATLGTTWPPQVLLRIGHGPAARPTPRRPLEEVLLH